MNKLITYINKVLQVNANILPLANGKSLPLFIRQAYEFFEGKLYSKEFIFLHPTPANQFGPEQFRVHAEMVQKTMHAQVIFVLDRVESFNRDRLIERRVNFIVPGRQLFLPSLLIDLKDVDLKPQAKRRILSPAAQCLLLYHLQRESLEGKSFNELEEKLPYSYLMITRSVQDLCSFSLCTLSKEKQKRLIFNEKRPVLWEKALPYLSNPIKKVYFLPDRIPGDSIKLAGISALSHYSRINDESLITMAISASDFRVFRIKETVTDPYAPEGKYGLQVWKYAPASLSTTQFVDPLSLFLTFNGTKDERIEQAIQTMIKEVLW